MGKKRILYWDVIKCIAIFLVVWDHCLQFCQSDDNYVFSDPLSALIVSFHMPLFMTISGYFAYSLGKSGFTDIFLRKSRQLLLPSVMVYFLVGLVLIFIRKTPFIEGLMSLLGFCVTSYWFLKVLFLFYLVSSITVIFWRKSKFAAICLLLMGGFFLAEQLDKIHFASTLPFFLFGIILHQKKQWFFSHTRIIGIFSACIYIVLCLTNRVMDYNMYMHPFTWEVDAFNIWLLRTVIGVTGSLFFIIIIRWICIRMGESNSFLRLMARVGTTTLGIYVYHRMIVMFTNQYCLNAFEQLNIMQGTHYEAWFYDIAICLPLAIIILIASYMAILFTRRYRWFKLLLLGEK